MFGLHNATLVRKVLPRLLMEPRPLYEDRKTRHAEIVTTLRTTQAAKRACTQEKRKATIALNQAKKQSVEAAINQGQITGQDPNDEMEIILDDEEGDCNETPPI